MKNNRLHLLTLGTVLLLAAILVAALQLEQSLASALFVESGPVETLTAALFLIGSLLVFSGPELARRWPAAAILLMFGLRELDFHDRFTTMNISKTRFYLSPDVPIMEKIFGLCVVLFFFACVYLLIKRYGKAFTRQTLRAEGLAVASATSLLFLVVSKLMDGLPRRLKMLGISMDEGSRFLATAGEELLELGAAILLLVCAIAARKLKPPAHAGSASENTA
jgi:hypothetical protein